MKTGNWIPSHYRYFLVFMTNRECDNSFLIFTNAYNAQEITKVQNNKRIIRVLWVFSAFLRSVFAACYFYEQINSTSCGGDRYSVRWFRKNVNCGLSLTPIPPRESNTTATMSTTMFGTIISWISRDLGDLISYCNPLDWTMLTELRRIRSWKYQRWPNAKTLRNCRVTRTRTPKLRDT